MFHVEHTILSMTIDSNQKRVILYCKNTSNMEHLDKTLAQIKEKFGHSEAVVKVAEATIELARYNLQNTTQYCREEDFKNEIKELEDKLYNERRKKRTN